MSPFLHERYTKITAAKSDAQQHILSSSASSDHVSQVMKILHIEDSMPGKVLVREWLRRDPENNTIYHVTQVDKVGDALTELHENHYDLVLADLHLPDSYGIETVTALRQASPDTPIIIHTGTQDIKLLEQAMQYGVCRIPKGNEEAGTFGHKLKDALLNGCAV